MFLADKISKFNAKANEHVEKQKVNPFSGSFSNRNPVVGLSKDQYGRPVSGSKTEQRGQKAKSLINKEILELCEVIYDAYQSNIEELMREDPNYEPLEDEAIFAPFGELFQIYSNINNKLVGLLIAAKKRGLVYFEKEILFQRRDDDVPILLLKSIQEIRIEMRLCLSPSPQRELEDEDDNSSTPSPK